MSENQSRDDMNFKEEEDGEEKQKMPSTLGASSKFQPIKTRIRQLEKDMQELRSNINENKKAGMTIKGELAVLETTIKEKCNELCKCIMDDLANFDKDLKRVIQNFQDIFRIKSFYFSHHIILSKFIMFSFFFKKFIFFSSSHSFSPSFSFSFFFCLILVFIG